MNIGEKSVKYKISRHYKTESILYLILILTSLVIIGFSLLISESNRWFPIVAGVGCSGIASVIVAWLLDIAACKRKEVANKELLDHIFEYFDNAVQNELNCILETCAKRNSDVNIEKEYSISEVNELLNQTDGSLPAWEKSYHNFGVAYASIDASLLLSSDPIPQHNEMYAIVRRSQDNYRAYEFITSRFKIEQESSHETMAYIFLQGDICGAERIFFHRHKKEITCAISEYGKKIIKAMREKSPK